MQNDKFSNIDYEDCEVGIHYAITLSPIDRLQYFGEELKSRSGLYLKRVKEVLTYLKSSATIEVYHEISKLGRLHCHGYVTIHDKNDWYLKVIPYLQNYFTFCIKEIEDEGDWEEYCCKQNDPLKVDVVYYPSWRDPLFKGKRTPKKQKAFREQGLVLLPSIDEREEEEIDYFKPKKPSISDSDSMEDQDDLLIVD